LADYRHSHTAPGYGRSYDAVFRRNPHRSVIWHLERRVLDRIVQQRFEGREIRLLDFACGTGRILTHLENRVAQAVGVDVAPSMLEVARAKVRRSLIIQADLTCGDVLGDAKFDLITAFRFFPNAQAQLRREALSVLSRHLDRDGYLVFNNHQNASSLLRRLVHLLGRAPGHGMSQAEVDDLVAGAGLRVVSTDAVGLMPFTERHPILPGPLLRMFEGAASRCGLFKGLFQDLVFTCAHFSPTRKPDGRRGRRSRRQAGSATGPTGCLLGPEAEGPGGTAPKSGIYRLRRGSRDSGQASGGAGRDAVARLRKFPWPYEAAVTVASDIDDASHDRFAAIHALLGGTDVITPESPHWKTLGLSRDSRWYEPAKGGVEGLGLDLADSMFLIADEAAMGMYRFNPERRVFEEDVSDGRNACEAIKGWLRQGLIDSFHAFWGYRREQVLPLLSAFYRWCEAEGVPKPAVWINHSLPVTPTGLCPNRLQRNRCIAVGRLAARWAVGPLLGRDRRPLRYALSRYLGDSPGSPFYVNDVLAENGLRYVWLSAKGDEVANRIALPEQTFGDQASILDVVTMDDGVRYFRFGRCYGKVDAPRGYVVALRHGGGAIDASTLFTPENLETLCRDHGTCILYTHWALKRSFPIQDATIGHFRLLRHYRDNGRVWVAPLNRLLEWTRIRTFLRWTVSCEERRVLIDIEGVQDPVVGYERPDLDRLGGLAFEVPPEIVDVQICINGNEVPRDKVGRREDTVWICNKDANAFSVAQ